MVSGSLVRVFPASILILSKRTESRQPKKEKNNDG